MAYSKQTWDTNSYVNPTRMNHIEQGIYDASKKFTVVHSTTPSSTGTNSSWSFPTNEGFTFQNSIIVGFNVYRSQNTRYYSNASDYAIAWVDIANGNAGGRVLLVDSNYSECQCDIILMRTDI